MSTSIKREAKVAPRSLAKLALIVLVALAVYVKGQIDGRRIGHADARREDEIARSLAAPPAPTPCASTIWTLRSSPPVSRTFFRDPMPTGLPNLNGRLTPVASVTTQIGTLAAGKR